jgi:polyphosphate kinase
MERNFFRRIEVGFPIQRAKHRKRILADLETYLADNVDAWELRADGSYVRVAPDEAERCCAQEALLERYAD